MPAAADVVAIEGVVRRYAWGSRTAIPALLGIEPDGWPVAELWLGAHEDDPSPVVGHGATLQDLVAADPVAALGSPAAEHFGRRLPFLLKVLAADKALSIQVHPNLEQARAGFAAEEAAGVPRGASERNYRDANHKPELICALTPFAALCGFRRPAEVIAVLDALGVPGAAPARAQQVLDGVRGDLSLPVPAQAIRAAVTRLLALSEPDRTATVNAVVASSRSLSPEPSSDAGSDGIGADVVGGDVVGGDVVGADVVGGEVVGGELTGVRGAAHVVQLCARDFPDDIGCVLSLMLKPVLLAPGQAMYLGAGTVHCYLRGMGVEVMANSDNVLRCGLTPKYVDIAELIRITDFAPLAEPRVRPVMSEGLRTLPTPAEDFQLAVAELADTHLRVTRPGPHIVLCTAGTVEVRGRQAVVAIGAGQAAFAPAATGGFTIAGSGTAFVAGVGLDEI